MVRNLSPMLRQELQNLEKGRKSDMKALRMYVKELDSKTIPQFLGQVSETKDVGSLFGEHAISLYGVLASTQGVKIVPQIGNIMGTIVKTLSSVTLHQACAKVVLTIARFGIDPMTLEDEKRSIIHLICKPLSDCLMGSHESLSAGAALCLKCLVDSDNWRFVSPDMVNEVCMRAAGALEGGGSQTDMHMSLITALARKNALIVEAYGRLLIESGLRIFRAGLVEGDHQKRLSAILMVNFLLKCLDLRSIVSELRIVIEEMEKCRLEDQMRYVKEAAYECFLTAKGIAARNGAKFKPTGSYNGSSNVQSDSSQIYSTSGVADETLSPFGENDSFLRSSISTSPNSCNNGYTRRGRNRKQWRLENGGLDVSLKDGILLGPTREGKWMPDSSEGLGQSENSADKSGCTDEFAGFVQGYQSATPSPPRARSLISIDNVKIYRYSTPRKLMQFLQDPVDINSEVLSPCSNRDWSPHTGYDQNASHYSDDRANEDGYTSAESEEIQIGSESVSSTEDILHNEKNTSPPPQDASIGLKTECDKTIVGTELRRKRATYQMLLCIFLLVLAVMTSFILSDGQDEGKILVPT